MSQTNIASMSEEELLRQLKKAMSEDLQPLEPQAGVERYLDHKRSEVTTKTIHAYEDDLAEFVGFLDERGIDDLRDVDGRLLDEYRSYLRYESSDVVDELATSTMRDELFLLRDFIDYLDEIDAVRMGLSDSIRIPTLAEDEGVRNVDMDPERVERVLDYLHRFEYASLSHVIWILNAKVARRISGLLSLDVDDAHLDVEDPYLEFQHRPSSTRLKNKMNSEGQVAIGDDVAEVLDDYIERVRPDVMDDDGRRPLLASRHGRLATSTFRRHIYRWSRPCALDGSCPHDEDPEECEAAQSSDQASMCPSSRSPHSLRHGFISEARRRGIPIDVISDRCDVSEEVIREVYDESTQSERLEARRKILDEYGEDNGGGYL